LFFKRSALISARMSTFLHDLWWARQCGENTRLKGNTLRRILKNTMKVLLFSRPQVAHLKFIFQPSWLFFFFILLRANMCRLKCINLTQLLPDEETEHVQPFTNPFQSLPPMPSTPLWDKQLFWPPTLY
jgi:hypothetical protein